MTETEGPIGDSARLNRLADFELWLADELRLGLVDFERRAADSTRAAAKRLQDAGAHGLARSISRLPEQLAATEPRARVACTVRVLGELALLATAYRNCAALDACAQHDLERRV